MILADVLSDRYLRQCLGTARFSCLRQHWSARILRSSATRPDVAAQYRHGLPCVPVGTAVMRLIRELRSQLQYKIILPFLLLTLLVALAGSAVAFLLITGTAEERLHNQLAQSARAAGDNIALTERANLQFLREVTFAGPNVATGAPAVADALAEHNVAGLKRALAPFYAVSLQRPGVQIDRMLAFDSTRHSVIDWERPLTQASAATYTEHPSRDIAALWFVSPILGKQHDQLGDKYAGLLDLGDGSHYLFTVA